nr:uncharacterized protein LOC117985907 isoform X2 [Maniola hyperantus]
MLIKITTANSRRLPQQSVRSGQAVAVYHADRPKTMASVGLVAWIEDRPKTCRPATSLYNQFIELISSGYYNLVKAICDVGRGMVTGGESETGPAIVNNASGVSRQH